MVLETIGLDNYNRRYGDKKPKSKMPKKDSTNSSSEDKQIGYTSKHEKSNMPDKKTISNQYCRFCGKPNWSLEHLCPVRRAQCNNCKKVGHFPKMCKSKTVNRINEAPTSGSNTESWPEIDLIQSVKCSNRVAFSKAILLVQGQPKESIIDTGFQ